MLAQDIYGGSTLAAPASSSTGGGGATDSPATLSSSPVYSVYAAHNAGGVGVGVGVDDAMEATRILRDNVYMSPQLVNLTNTLRSKKMRCQAGSGHCGGTRSLSSTPVRRVNDPTMLPETEVVFR